MARAVSQEYGITCNHTVQLGALGQSGRWRLTLGSAVPVLLRRQADQYPGDEGFTASMARSNLGGDGFPLLAGGRGNRAARSWVRRSRPNLV